MACDPERQALAAAQQTAQQAAEQYLTAAEARAAADAAAGAARANYDVAFNNFQNANSLVAQKTADLDACLNGGGAARHTPPCPHCGRGAATA